MVDQFDADIAAYYTQHNQEIEWRPSAIAYSVFTQGPQRVAAVEKSHQFAGFLFQPNGLSAQNQSELRLLAMLASDHYYFETATFPVSPYTAAKWELWLHYPPGYHGPSLRASW